MYGQSLEINRSIGDRQNEAISLGYLGTIAEQFGKLAEAERLHQESLAIEREIGDRQGEAISLHELGTIAFAQGDLDAQRNFYTESVRIRREIGVPIDKWFVDNGY